MFLHLLFGLLAELSTQKVLGEPCGGLTNVYVCNPTSPSRFDICVGDQKYTMTCPGGLHFNSRTQVCDWPQNADCGRNPSGQSPFARTEPKPHYRKSPSPPNAQPEWHRHQEQQQTQSNRDQNSRDMYDVNSQQQQEQSEDQRWSQNSHSQQQSRNWFSDFTRAPQTSSDPRFSLDGPKNPYKKEDSIVKYHDQGYVHRRHWQRPFAYKDRRAHIQQQTDNQQQDQQEDERRVMSIGLTGGQANFEASRTKSYDQSRKRDFNPAQILDGSQNGDVHGGDERLHNREDGQEVAKDNNSKNNNYVQDTSNVKRKDRYSLHHYPWWTSRSSSPVSSNQREPSTPTPSNSNTVQYNNSSGSKRPSMQLRGGRYSARWVNPKKYSQRTKYQGLLPSYQPTAVARRMQQHQRAQQVPARQVLSAAAAASPPAKSITAAAASQPKWKEKPRVTGHCSAKTCQLPDCRCVGSDIPGGLNVKDTPQMVMLTFDDSVNIANFDYFTKLFDETKFRNPNGCPIKGTFFVSGDATQYHYVEKLHKRGHEIASHSISHRSPTTYWASAGYDGYVKEIEGMRKKLTKQSKVPREEIRGMRVPFLQVGGDDQYQMLEDYGFVYDTSMVTGHLYKNDHPPIWPFTLDYPPSSKTCSLTPCPTKSYPGLWEVPLIRWYGSNRMACAMPDGCTIDPGTEGTVKFLEDNFKRHYETNRSPVGIFLHASWFRRKDGNLEGLLQFLENVSKMKDVWVVSVSQVIDWIKNPVPNSQAGKIPSWSCK